MRYRFVLVIVLVLLASGCVGVLAGDEPLEFTASEATVSDEALAETGYELGQKEPVEIDETIEVMDTERDVLITNHVAGYERGGDASGGDAPAFFMVVSTPDASVAGQSLNPLGSMDKDRLIEEVSDRGDGFDDVEKIDSQSVTILGTETDASTYRATSEMEGESIELTLYVTRVAHDGDLVIAIGGHPAMVEGERENILRLMEGIEH